jgi:copper chaperone CopZ
MGDVKKIELATSGMHCPSCAMLIEMALKKEDGVFEARADYPGSRTTVSFDPDVTDEGKIIAKIESLGYTAEVG